LFAQLKQQEAEARLWAEIAGVHERAGREPETLAAWGRARGLHRELGDRRGELTAIEGLARATRRHVHDASLALTYYEEAATFAEALEARAVEGRVRTIIGILEWERGNYETALDQYRRALTRFRECEDPTGIGLALNSMGAAARALGRREDARRILREAVLHNRRARREALLGHTLAQLGAIEMDAEEPAAAAPYFEESLAIRVRRGDTRGEGWMRYELARVAIARAEPGRARDLLAAAARLADACGDAELAESCERRRRTAGL
jgi:tetratricopeptide (TPR) repeat protein